MRLQYRVLNKRTSGFSLVELLLAASIGGLISAVAADAMLTHLKANERLEATERLRTSWSRTVHFIESEIALSERVITKTEDASTPADIGIGLDQCQSSIQLDEFRFALDLRRDIPPAIYYVRENNGSNLEWDQTQSSLWRCGPIINKQGNYINEISGDTTYTVNNQRLVDGLQGDTCTLVPTPSDSGVSKSLNFTLCIQGFASNGYNQAATTHSRVSPVFTYPTLTSLCSNQNLQIEGFYKLDEGDETSNVLSVPSSNVPEDKDVLICGYGGGDKITGSIKNDVLEAGEKDPEPAGSIMSGRIGNDRLRGSRAGDTLIGGEGNDVLVGWDGDDRLVGENEPSLTYEDVTQDPILGSAGKNDYRPGPGNDTIIGGTGLDVVFFDKSINEYEISTDCDRSNCEVKEKNGNQYTVTAEGVEILIFRDGRRDL
jgi:prepilin-type N-terminal cleavage/methylation domain-containing protein